MTIKASTMSVILRDSKTVGCYLEFNGESCNLTLRFDRGNEAKLCGYPMEWGVHDVNVDYYNPESPTFAELVEADGVLNDGQPYISAETEALILKRLKTSVARQFRSKDWSKCTTKRQRGVILRKIQRAIDKLNQAT